MKHVIYAFLWGFGFCLGIIGLAEKRTDMMWPGPRVMVCVFVGLFASELIAARRGR